MTEIPEHLLKRSRERRAAIGGGDAGGGDDTASPAATEGAAPSAAVEAAPPATPAAPPPPPEPEPPKPLPVYVQAALRRRRIPYWAMPVLVFLPVWAYLYQGTLEPPPAGESDPIVLGGELYSAKCASCHGAGGGGGVGPKLSGGEVLKTWPDYRDHMMWVRLGDEGWPADTYGAQAKSKGSGMPSHPTLTDQELAQIILYERQGLSGEDPALEADLIAIANGEKTFEEVGLGALAEKAGVTADKLASPA